MDITFSIAPYLYNHIHFSDPDLVRDTLLERIPMNKKLRNLKELDKIMKGALVVNMPDRNKLKPECYIIPRDREFIVNTYEDDEVVRFTLKNKRVGRFEASFNALVVYMIGENFIIPISIFTTGEPEEFLKDDDRNVIVELQKEY